MDEQTRTYRWYLIIAVIYSFFATLVCLSVTIFKVSDYAQIMMVRLGFALALLMFIFNIAMLTVFIEKKIEKIAWLLSGMYIFDFFFSTTLGLIFYLDLGKTASQSVVGNIAGSIFPIITLMLAIILLMRR